jgi:hypothetical protein
MVRQTHGRILTEMRVRRKYHSQSVSHDRKLVGVVLQSEDMTWLKKKCTAVSVVLLKVGIASFVGVKMTLLTLFHGVNAIVKQGRPKVTFSDNLLSSGYS